MADRYWVGGTGTWSAASTANWSDTSGGASGFSAPTAADNVFFDANSNVGTGAFTVTVSGALCNDFNVGSPTALDGAMTLAFGAVGTLTVSGSWTNQATNFSVTNTNGLLTFNATTTGKTITTNGVTIGVNTTLNGVGGAWTLGSPLNISTFTLTLTNGTFDTSASNHAVNLGFFNSSNSNTRTINLNGSIITTNSAASGGVWNIATSTNATLNAGTSTINIGAPTVTFSGGGLTYYNVSFTSTTASSTRTITGANTFTNNLTFGSLASNGFVEISVGANQTINGTLTVTGANGPRRYFVRSDTIGTTRTLTCAAIAAMTDVDFRDITIAGAAGTLSGTRLGDCGGNSNITFVAGKTVYWNLAAGGSWNSTAWALGSGGTPADANFPLAQDTAIIENTGLNTGVTISNNAGYNIGNFDASTRTNALTFTTAGAPTWNGNFVWGTGITTTSNVTWVFTNRSTKTLNSAGYTFPNTSFTVNAPGGGIQLLTNNLTLASTLTTTLTQGTLDLNNLTLSTGAFSSSNSNTRTIAFGTGNITCTGTGTVWTTATSTNLTTTGTQVVNVTSSGATAITVTPGTLSEANSISFNFTGGTYALTFLGSASNTARNVNFTGYAGTWQATSTGTIFGNLTISTGMSLTSSNSTLTFGATSGTQLITTNGKTLDFPISFNGAGGTFRLEDAMTVGTGSGRTTTLTNGSLNLNNFTLSTGAFSSDNSNTRSIAFGSTGSIILTTTNNGNTVLSMAVATNFTFTGTSNISTAMSVSRGFIFGSTAGATASNRLNINLTSGASVPTFTGSFRQINFTGSTSNPGNVTISCHGFTLASGGTYTSTDFTTVGDGTLTYTGKAIDILNINTAGITTTLADAGQNATTTLTNGTLDLAGFTLTSTTTATTAAGTKNLTFNGGTLVCSAASATAWNNAQPTNFTTTAGTGTGTISMTAATAKTFVGGGSTYNCTLNQGGAGTLTITGANTFNDITNTNATASQITFPASTTTTVNAFTLSGSSGNLVSLRSSTGGTRFTLSDPSGTVSVSFLNIQDSAATGGATWNAFTSNGNVDNGNNTGWNFVGGNVYAVSVSETATGSDVITLVLVRVGAVDETATGSDTTASRLDAVGRISETATGADTTASQLTTSGAISETATGADATASQLTASGAISETATAADSQVAQLDAVDTVSETATGADAAQGNIETTSAISETATGTDTEAATLTRVGAVSETAAAADDLTATASLQLFVNETTTGADEITNIASLQLFVDETAIAQDLPLGNIIATLQINEGATILDAALARLLWELINDNQLPGWQLIPNNQGSGWTIINTQAGGSWTNIDTV